MKILPSVLLTFSLAAITGSAHAVPITLQVLAADNSPVANAEVRTARQPGVAEMEAFFSPDEPQRQAARTDEKGVARFDWPAPTIDLLPGTAGSFVGVATIWAPGLGVANVRLRTGDNSVKLPLAGVARGTVRDEKAAPVAGVRVRAVGALGMEPLRNFNRRENFALSAEETVFTATTDVEGHWQIAGLPLGTRALVQIDTPAYAFAVATAPVVLPAAPPGAALLPIGQMPFGGNEKGELVAAPPATLTGRVLDPLGEPLARVTVWLYPAKNHAQTYAKPQAARTDEKGEYRLERLAADTYQIIVTPPETLPLVASSEYEKIAISSGQSVRAPDQKLLPGGTLAVRITDAKTGQPISGASASAQSTGGDGVNISPRTLTDETGILTMQVAAGSYRVQVWRAPSAYLYPEPSAPSAVVAGETKTLTIALQTGDLIRGRVVDDLGHVVPDFSFALVEDDEGRVGGGTAATTDATGAWKTQRFAPGHYKVVLNSSVVWELAAHTTIDVPRAAPLDIRVKAIAQHQLAGRIVDEAGQGVADVLVAATISVLFDKKYESTIQRTALSDAQGHYTLPDFPATAQSIVLSATRDGYAIQKAPAASKANNVWEASTGVLQERSSQLSGRVVDAQNQPQAGVQVLAARFASVAVSDENGNWRFANVAPGDVELVAVGAAGSVVQTVVADRENVTLKLRPFAPAQGRDIDSASAILEDAWQTSRGRNYYQRDSLPATLAPFDPDAALALARDEDGQIDESIIVKIVTNLARHDVERARVWAPQVLAGLKKPEHKLYAVLAVAQALADKYPDEAKKLLHDNTALYGRFTETGAQFSAAIALAALSQQLGLPDGEDWFARALELAQPQTTGWQMLAWGVGTTDADWTARAVEAAIKAAPTQTEIYSGPNSTLSAAVRHLAPWNLAAAQQMLEHYEALKVQDTNDPDGYHLRRAHAALIVENMRKNGDIDAAIKEARALKSGSIRTLSQLAELAPVERRGEILRDTLKLALDREQTKTLAIRIAWQLRPYDRAGAKAALDEIATGFDSTAPLDLYLSDNEVAAWAYAYRDLDAAQARWQLEREWARLLRESGSNAQTRDAHSSQLQKIITAMASLDVGRAQQMIFALPIDDNNAPFRAAQVLARWLLADTPERQSRPFEFWGADEDDDGLYADSW